MKTRVVSNLPLFVMILGLALGVATALVALRPSSSAPPVDAAHVAPSTQAFTVTASPNTAGEPAEYVFILSVVGSQSIQLMPANVAEFRVTFDKDTQVPAAIAANSVLIQASLLTNVAELGFGP